MRGVDGPKVALPRSQIGPQPQRLLLTLLGDYWFGRREHLPSVALVRLLQEFGSTSASSRTALSRLSRRGLLVSSKDGRHTFYGLSERASRVLAEGVRPIMSFGAADRPWDGCWTWVAFSVPEEQRQTRHALRTRLRWLGFAPLYDGLWVSPRASASAVADELDELGIVTATVLVGHVAARTGSDPISAWDLEGLRAAYGDFVDRVGSLRDRVRAGVVGSAEALIARTEVMDLWRNMPNLDPELPTELLPTGWPRARARAMFVEVYDALGPLAELRVREILAASEPELARLASHHTSEAFLAAEPA